jgi:1,4-alpha-glucan branching enzyme
MTPTDGTMPGHDPAEFDLLIAGAHGDPHRVLGPHVLDGTVVVRALKPLADSVTVVHGGQHTALRHEHGGVWAGELSATAAPPGDVPDYRLEVAYAGGPATEVDDPYRFLPTVGELDVHLISEGRHELLWNVLGAHVHHYPATTGPIHGTSFAVWAPQAKGVRIKGDFNN